MKEKQRHKTYLILILVVLILLWFLTVCARGHEGSGFKHMTGNSGPLIGQGNCGGDSFVWFHDDNLDSIIDRCSVVFIAHDTIHVAPSKLVIGEDGKPACTCKVIEYKY